MLSGAFARPFRVASHELDVGRVRDVNVGVGTDGPWRATWMFAHHQRGAPLVTPCLAVWVAIRELVKELYKQTVDL